MAQQFLFQQTQPPTQPQPAAIIPPQPPHVAQNQTYTANNNNDTELPVMVKLAVQVRTK